MIVDYKVYNASIARAKFQQFDEILKATGGRYLSNPRIGSTVVWVDYSPARDTELRLLQMCTSIVERRRDQWWRKLWRRIVAV